MKNAIHVSIVFLIFIICSCDKIKKNGYELVLKAEQKVKSKSKDLADIVSPHFDPYIPDTKYNIKRFKDFLQIELTQDIKNIYCFDDAIGIDYDFQFSFNCCIATATRIIAKHHLIQDTITTDYAFGLQNDFVWWDKNKIKKLKLYSWKGEREYYKYFWYDETEQKAYYFDFDL